MFYLGSGYNDGMIPVSSAQWGTFRGTEYGSWWSYGVDHLDMVNMNPNGVNFDVVGGYVKLVKDLKAKGY
jgi:triacylglycerol lipase